MKYSVNFHCSAVPRHPPSSWAAVVHWSALMPKGLRSFVQETPHPLFFLAPHTARAPHQSSGHHAHLDTLVKTGSESIEATLRRRRISFVRFVARMEDTTQPKCVMFGEMVGGAGCVGGQEKEWDGVFPGRPQSFRHQRRPVDDCSPGRGVMSQNGRTRGGTFHGEIDRCRGSQGWTTACSGMPERDGKDQGEDSPNSGLVLVRSTLLTSHK